jgi:hypothetical protein
MTMTKVVEVQMDDNVVSALQTLRRKLDREFHHVAKHGAKEMTITLTVPIDTASYMIIGLEDILATTRSIS